MEPSGSHFRRPPPRASFSPRRSRFGPVPGAPLITAARSPRGPRPPARARTAGGPRAARAGARRLGAMAFYGVAALALVGAALALTGHEPGIVIGLGLTRFTDALAAGTEHALALAALAHAALVAGFALLGRLAQRGRFWAFATGAAVYALDGLLVLAAHDWVAVAIHTAVLVMVVRGLDAGRRVS